MERRAFLQELLEAPSRALVLLEAPAGFGKTCILAQWRNQVLSAGGRVIWIGLRAADREAEQFAKTLTAAAASAGLPGQPRRDGAQFFREGFLALLARDPCQILLVLDDYHQAQGPECDALVRDLIQDQPENVRIAIASRRAVRFSLSAPLMEGRLRRIDKAQLLFSRNEARSFFENSLTPQELQSLHLLTEGWPAAFAIARACVAGWRESRKDIRSFPQFSSLISDYCRTDVLSDLAPSSVAFLIDTAALETLQPDLCDAVREANDSAALLAELNSHHCILTPVSIDANSWRVSALLRQVLVWRARERGTAHVTQAHLRAAIWLERTGSIREAVAHYLAAGQPDAAAATLERANPMRIAAESGDAEADALLDLLPAQVLLDSPRLMLARAYTTFKRGLMEEAELMFEDLRARTNGFRGDTGASEDNSLLLEGLILEGIIRLYRRSSTSIESVRDIAERTAACGKSDHLLLSLAHICVALLYELRGDLEAALGHLIQSEQLNVKAQGGHQALWNIHHHGSISLARGQLMDARYQFQLGMKRWRRHYGASHPFGALTGLLLAEIDYENAAFAEAQMKLDEALHTAEHIEGWFQHYASAYETQMMLLLHSTGSLQAEAFLARTAAVRRVTGGLHRFLQVLHLRLALLRADYEEARAIVAAGSLKEKWSRADCHDHFGWREWDLLGVCLSHLAIHDRDFAGALETVDRLEQVARFAGRARTQVRALMLRSGIDFTEGERGAAIVHLSTALDLGHARGFWQTFVDEASLIEPILTAILSATDVPVPRHIAAFSARLLQALRIDDSAVADDRVLSDREKDVVRELSLGSSNKVIARKLGLSEPTVKFHLVNIFRKLHVRKRASAVVEAHRRGWLS